MTPEKHKKDTLQNTECLFLSLLPYILVGYIGKKCHLACSLDSSGELSLVKSTSAGYTSGEDLCSLGNELSELSNVLVIDSLNLVLAEDTNLLSSVVRTESGALRFVSLHCKVPLVTFPTHDFCISRPAVSLAGRGRRQPELEGKSLVVRNFFKACGVSTVEGGSTVCLRGIRTAANCGSRTVLVSRSYEGNLVGYYLDSRSLLTLVILPSSGLKLTADENRITLLEIAADKFSILSPCNNVDKINGRLVLIRALSEATVDRDRERAYGKTACSLLKLGVGSHVADENNFIEACHFSASKSIIITPRLLQPRREPRQQLLPQP